MENSEHTYGMKLLHTIRMTQSFSHFLSTPERNDLAKTCIEVKNSMDWNFKFHDFYEILYTYQYPPLEFLWHLHLLQIMPLESFISSIYTENEKLKEFQKSVVNLCVQDFDEIEVQYLVQTGFLSYLVRKAFPVTDVVNFDRRTKEVCLEVLKKLLQEIFMVEENQFRSRRFSAFFSIWNAGTLEETALQEFCLFAFEEFLNLYPSGNDLDAFEIFESSNSSFSSHYSLIVIEKLLIPLKFEKILHVLSFAVRNLKTDVKCLLFIIIAFVNIHEESSALVERLLSELSNESYENLRYDLLLRSLLIRRQLTHQPIRASHVCYKQWLQRIFSDCGHLRNAQCFSLLIQVLSDLVPFYKSIECLKVAIDLKVAVPPTAHSVYNDYIILLKTRVHDLKPHVKPEETVEKILSLYEILGKIPPVIMEASLLQKHKFLNEFLPALLVPRLVPQTPDIKEKFIEALYKTGKIPNNLLQKYRHECQQEQQTLLADIDIEDFDEDDVIILDS